MKFRMVTINYRSTPDYPWNYRIELTEYSLKERAKLTEWLERSNIQHIAAGWNLGSVLYLKEQDADLFALKWS